MVWSGPGALLWDWGVLDFAGGTVVHVNAGIAGLAAALVIGRRQGYPGAVIPPHNVPFALVGAALLWVGWFGFNAGSALAANGTAGMASSSRRSRPPPRRCLDELRMGCPPQAERARRRDRRNCGPRRDHARLRHGRTAGRIAHRPPRRRRLLPRGDAAEADFRLRRFARRLRRARRRRHRRRRADRRDAPVPWGASGSPKASRSAPRSGSRPRACCSRWPGAASGRS